MKKRDESGQVLNSEHLDDEHYHNADVQRTADYLGGTTALSDQSKEVQALAYERHCLEQVAKEIAATLDVATKQVSRVVQASGEVVFRTVACKANIPSKICAFNYERSRLLITTPATTDVAIGTDPQVALDGFNTTRISYAATTTPACREVRSVRDMWIVAGSDCTVGIQEEFVS